MPRKITIGLLLAGLLAAVGLGALHTGIYGWEIFVVLPWALGGLASWLFRPATGVGAALLGALAVAVASSAMLIGGQEGAICILMSLPLTAPLGALGGWLVYRGRSSRATAPSGFAAILLLTPATLSWDSTAKPDVFRVHSAITIAAPPEVVWKHVVTFSELPPPREWWFHTGIAYPKRARIVGTGPGAVRYCEFSTGPFVEPIMIWDEPRLLRFRVAANPAPMEEWSPYGHLFPKHLHGYLVSKQGEFRLTQLPGNRTLLEGTTWYQHGLWPSHYWSWWSAAIIHRIHLRVMNHIRALAEAETLGRMAYELPKESSRRRGILTPEGIAAVPPASLWARFPATNDCRAWPCRRR